MAVIGIRRTAWENATDVQRSVLRWARTELALGIPALYDNAGTEWFVFSDLRISLGMVARLGALVDKLADISPTYQLPTIIDSEGTDTGIVDREAVKEKVVQVVQATVVLPADITYTRDGDPYDETMQAQNAPAAIRAADSVPAGWARVETA